MTKKSAHPKTRKKIDWDAVCERTRQRCNKLTEEEHRQLRDAGLRIIYSADAEAPVSSR